MTFSIRGPGLWRCLLAALLSLVTAVALAHGVSDADKDFPQGASGVQILPFLYLGAQHMVSGYDHLLFLCGVIFFLYRLKDIGLYVLLFVLGHSTTLLHNEHHRRYGQG